MRPIPSVLSTSDSVQLFDCLRLVFVPLLDLEIDGPLVRSWNARTRATKPRTTVGNS